MKGFRFLGIAGAALMAAALTLGGVAFANEEGETVAAEASTSGVPAGAEGVDAALVSSINDLFGAIEAGLIDPLDLPSQVQAVISQLQSAFGSSADDGTDGTDESTFGGMSESSADDPESTEGSVESEPTAASRSSVNVSEVTSGTAIETNASTSASTSSEDVSGMTQQMSDTPAQISSANDPSSAMSNDVTVASSASESSLSSETLGVTDLAAPSTGDGGLLGQNNSSTDDGLLGLGLMLITLGTGSLCAVTRRGEDAA